MDAFINVNKKDLLKTLNLAIWNGKKYCRSKTIEVKKFSFLKMKFVKKYEFIDYWWLHWECVLDGCLCEFADIVEKSQSESIQISLKYHNELVKLSKDEAFDGFVLCQ